MDFSNQTTKDLRIMKETKEEKLFQKEKNLREINWRIEQMQSCVFEADKMGIPEWCPTIKRDHRRLENEIVQIKNELDEITKILRERELPEMLASLEQRMIVEQEILKIWGERGVPPMLASLERRMRFEHNLMRKWGKISVPRKQDGTDCCLGRLQHDFMTKVNIDVNPSGDAKSFKNSDKFENRRNCMRNEVSANRQNSQSKAANLNRGLAMDEDGQGASKSGHNFDLTPLDEALPPASHCSEKAPVECHSLELEEEIMIYSVENKELLSADAATQTAYVTMD